MGHGYCYLWKPEIVWLHVTSDALITLAYYSIPLSLLYFARKRKDLPFHWVFLMFGAFILSCGTTHLMEIWTIWHGTYRLAGVIKLITAIAVGNDVAWRIGNSFDWKMDWFHTVVVGYFTAALSAGRILKLNGDQLFDALGLAFGQAGGTGEMRLSSGSSIACSTRSQNWPSKSASASNSAYSSTVSQGRRLRSSCMRSFCACVKKASGAKR